MTHSLEPTHLRAEMIASGCITPGDLGTITPTPRTGTVLELDDTARLWAQREIATRQTRWRQNVDGGERPRWRAA